MPNLTIGAPVVKSLRAHTQAFLDCHLMVTDPGFWVDDFAKAGASQLTFHVEAVKDAAALIERIHKAGMKAGVALRPKTPVEAVLPAAALADLVLVMTVEPGFGGQAFMPEMMPKVKTLRERFPRLNIQVDGGLAEDTIEQAARAGANVIVSGSGIFKAKDPQRAIAVMRQAVDSAA